MHSYDAAGRPRIIAFLAGASILLVWMLHAGLGVIDFEPRWWLSVPSFAGVFSGLCWAFDLWVWRLGLLRKLGIVPIPDLNGRWDGRVESSYDGGVYPVSIVIRQRWLKMTVTLEAEQSRSRSTVASLRTDSGTYPELSYLYVNEPKAVAAGSMNIHGGTAVVELRDRVLEGHYYTGRGRMTHGAIKVVRMV